MIRAIAFDFDGVLAESVHVKTSAFQKLFAGEAPEVLDLIVRYHLENGGVSRFEKIRFIYRQFLQRELTEDHFKLLCDRFAELVVNEVVDSPWVEGAREFLTSYRRDYRFFVITGTPEAEMKVILERRGMTGFFEEVFGSPRTKTVLLRHLLKTCGLSPADVVFIGDSPTDWNAAKETVVPFIWRQSPQGVPPPDDFKGPRISSLKELPACLMDPLASHA